MWFESLFGFEELSPKNVWKNLVFENGQIRSIPNGRRLNPGTLTIPSLRELRETLAVQPGSRNHRALTVSEIVADVEHLHADPQNAGALFQVASQFNLLEMISPERKPEDGISIYEEDRTQGPACARACGAGTLYRNYFIQWNDGTLGQSEHNQIDTLQNLGEALGNSNSALWTMQNGYALVSEEGLFAITEKLGEADVAEREHLKGLLRIGIQSDTEVTVESSGHFVTQALCSALPVAYTMIYAVHWEHFARLVLEAAYEATFCAAVLNARRTGCNKVFLTLLGGGVFGNRIEWIIDALSTSLHMFKYYELDVFIVSYCTSNQAVRKLVEDFEKT